MAPLSHSIAQAMVKTAMETRSSGGNKTVIAPSITPAQGNILQILALTFSAFSVASAILAFYWFMKMRRNFRHDLIMLLIQSDMFKALWFMMYPIVVFANGSVGPTFCQVNGFFISLGIEASDIAVLMIAVHTALHIFKPNISGEGGLYPYRHVAYTVWVVFPLSMASLAFINDRNAYVPIGTYCYLPVRPLWYRLALSWIPRYIIFIIILSIYASIYYFVRYKFDGFNRGGRVNSYPTIKSIGSEDRYPRSPRRTDLPPTPTLTCHGLIPESKQPTIIDRSEPGFSGNAPEIAKPKRLNKQTGTHRFMLASLLDGANSSPPSEPSTGDSDSFRGPTSPQPLSLLSPVSISPRPAHSIPESQVDSRATSWRDTFVRRFSPDMGSTDHSVVSIFSVLRRHPDAASNETPISQLQLINSRGQTFAEAEMLRTRDKVRRQMRFVFIYPLVYIGMWILPFVSHVLQYDFRFAVNPPFALTCVTTVCLCSQAAVDCWLFSTREKPWRHIPGTEGSFWVSLKFWSGWSTATERRPTHGPGKTREEMRREARAAYRRRDEELALRRNQVEGTGVQGESSKKAQKSWWEGPGVDGTMSPVAEEVSNPMDDVARREVLESSEDETANSDTGMMSDGETTLQGSGTMGSIGEETMGEFRLQPLEHIKPGKQDSQESST